MITAENLNINFKTRLLEILENNESKIVKYSLKKKIDVLQNKIAIMLYKDLENHLGNFIIQEIQEIQTSLKGDCFFNLTNEKLPQDLTSKLNLGRKFTPYISFNFKKELEIFEAEVSTMFKNYLKYEFNINFTSKPNFLNQGLRSLRKSSFVKNKPVVRNDLFSFHL